jgi:hypothetical protein
MTAIPEPHILDEWSGDPREILGVLEHAKPVPAESSRPEEWTISFETGEEGWLIVPQLADPQWTAHLIGPGGRRVMTAPLLPTFRKAGEPGGWQRVDIPRPGHWTLRLEYEAHDVAEGLAISTVAGIAWTFLAITWSVRAWRSRGTIATGTDRAEGPSGDRLG